MGTKQMMREAKQALSGNWQTAALGTFLWVLFFLGLVGGAGLIISIILQNIGIDFFQEEYADGLLIDCLLLAGIGPLSAGYIRFLLSLIHKRPVEFSELLSGFSNFGTTFMIGIYTWLILLCGTLIFLLFVMILSGLFPSASDNMLCKILVICFGCIFLMILSLRVNWFPFFIYEESGRKLSAKDCILSSWKLVKGNEWTYYKLLLRFTGWNLVATITGGIGFYWVSPYVMTSIYYFYKDLARNGIPHSVSFKNSRDEIDVRWSAEKRCIVWVVIIFLSLFLI